MLHPRFLTDRYRLIRSLLVGSLAYLVSIQFLGLKESFTLSVTCALAWDFIQLFRHTWLLSIEQTRSIFTRWESNESFVAVRTIALVFMSIGILSFCISDLQHSSSVLPKSIHTLTTFFALFLIFQALQNRFYSISSRSGTPPGGHFWSFFLASPFSSFFRRSICVRIPSSRALAKSSGVIRSCLPARKYLPHFTVRPSAEG